MENDNDKSGSKEDFNRAAWGLYGTISGATFSLSAGIFCVAMAAKADWGAAWLVGAGIGLLGAVGGAYETYRQLAKPPPRDHEPKP